MGTSAGRATRPATIEVREVVPILGMTCRSCERRIEREVGRIDGVQRVRASAVRGEAEITSTHRLEPAAVAAAIRAAGYDVGRDPWLSTDRSVWLSAVVGVAVVVVMALLMQATGLADLAPATSEIASGGLIVALLLGLAAGVSTCLALTGGLVLALSASFAASRATDDLGIVARLRPSAVFLTSRIVAFGLLGAFLGMIGATFVLPPTVVAVVMVIVAVVMTLLGIRLTGLSPRIAGWTPTLPSTLAHTLGADATNVTAYSDGRAAALGVATFFLPCGFTQAVQVYALSTGSPIVAGAIMAVFAIGTAPGLLALSGLPSVIPATARPAFIRAVGVLVLAFALVNAAAALRLVGLSPTVAFGGGPVAAPVVTMDGDIQVLRTFQISTGYVPEQASLYSGMPTRWIVESMAGGSCAIFLQAPSLGVQVTLRPGDNAIELPPLRSGRIDYSCSMGMYGGSLTVVDPPPGAIEALPRS